MQPACASCPEGDSGVVQSHMGWVCVWTVNYLVTAMTGLCLPCEPGRGPPVPMHACSAHIDLTRRCACHPAAPGYPKPQTLIQLLHAQHAPQSCGARAPAAHTGSRPRPMAAPGSPRCSAVRPAAGVRVSRSPSLISVGPEPPRPISAGSSAGGDTNTQANCPGTAEAGPLAVVCCWHTAGCMAAWVDGRTGRAAAA